MSSKTILIVSNEPDYLEQLSAAFEFDDGYIVTTASSIEEARGYKDKEFDFVVIEGFDGNGVSLHDELNGKRKLIWTSNHRVVNEAKTRGLEAHLKITSLDLLKILENGTP